MSSGAFLSCFLGKVSLAEDIASKWTPFSIVCIQGNLISDDGPSPDWVLQTICSPRDRPPISEDCHLGLEGIFSQGASVLQHGKLRNQTEDLSTSAFDSSISDLCPCFSTFLMTFTLFVFYQQAFIELLPLEWVLFMSYFLKEPYII